jgi:hypothetical protein
VEYQKKIENLRQCVSLYLTTAYGMLDHVERITEENSNDKAP